jgi:hypothetical protein
MLLRFTYWLSLESFYTIHTSKEHKFKVYLNHSNSELTKKFSELHRDKKLKRKFVLVILAIREHIANSTQWNFESKSPLGDIYAIKVEQHRFCTLVRKSEGYRELYVS